MADRSWGTPVIGLDKISISCQNLHRMQSIIVAKGWTLVFLHNRPSRKSFYPPKLAAICRLILRSTEARRGEPLKRSTGSARSPRKKHDADGYGLHSEAANERRGAEGVKSQATWPQDRAPIRGQR